MKFDRDTYFAGFAKLLYQDMCDTLGNYFVISEDLNEQEKQACLKLFAQRAFDLVMHADNYAPVMPPDLTQWPDPR